MTNPFARSIRLRPQNRLSDQLHPAVAAAQRPFMVRTCNRTWLRVKLHLLVEHDPQGMRDFNSYLDIVAGRRIHVTELLLATMQFGDTSREPMGDTTKAIVSVVVSYLVVPFWQWRKLNRAFKAANKQLS